MTAWLRFRHDGETGFGALAGDGIAVHDGDMFGANRPNGRVLDLDDVELLAPTEPSKIVALWNNFHALAAKLNQPEPPEPLYLLKATTSVAAPGAVIRPPAVYSGKTTYEGELGIVIGKRCSMASEAEAADAIFGYTCINDVTAADLINKNPTFAQWVRAKSFDTFGVFGPVVATGLDPMTLTIKTMLNGEERQNYPVADMYFPPVTLVALISRDMTLEPGDVIACGTSVGVGVMKEPKNVVEVTIDGIGTLSNRFDQ
jgi:2-keto-4-pentenoate hydratase/2-oxohepta-3-ene-1,7-dioic acid hydratase in catechol pathway